MLIGVNITSAAGFRRAGQFWDDGLIDFFELLIDNFLHVEPGVLAAGIRGRPVAIHIMSSRFLHRRADELAPLAERLRALSREFRPLYVSDHLACHEIAGQALPELTEVDYDDAALISATARWQDMLGEPLLLENYPSGGAAGIEQVRFFAELHRAGAASPLLDFSNAVVAEKNGGAASRDWVTSGLPLTACHISGYRPSDVDDTFFVDSHDCAVSAESWDLFAAALRQRGTPGTLVVERDERLDEDSWADDLRYARALAAKAASQ